MGIPLVIEDGLWYNKMFQICARNGAFQREEALHGHTRRTPGEDAPAVSGDGAGGLCGPRGPGAVSYTHLTLPTN